MLCAQVDGQRAALHVAHTRQYDQEMAKLIDANMMNCKPIMRRLCTMRRPVKPLRNLPERYRYLLQNGAGADPAFHPVRVSNRPGNPGICS